MHDLPAKFKELYEQVDSRISDLLKLMSAIRKSQNLGF